MFSHLAYEFAEPVFLLVLSLDREGYHRCFRPVFGWVPASRPRGPPPHFRESRLGSRAGFSVCGARAWYLARCPVPPAVLACGRAVLHCRPWSCQAGVSKVGQRGFSQARPWVESCAQPSPVRWQRCSYAVCCLFLDAVPCCICTLFRAMQYHMLRLSSIRLACLFLASFSSSIRLACLSPLFSWLRCFLVAGTFETSRTHACSIVLHWLSLGWSVGLLGVASQLQPASSTHVSRWLLAVASVTASSCTHAIGAAREKLFVSTW